MADVDVVFQKKITVNKSPEEVFKYISDFKKTSKHVPGLETFKKTGENRYLWKFKPVGAMGVEIAAEYETEFEVLENKCVKWQSIPGSGNTDVKGEFRIKKKGDGSELELKVETVAHLPIPGFAKSIARPFVEKNVKEVMEGYLRNLKEALEGKS